MSLGDGVPVEQTLSTVSVVGLGHLCETELVASDLEGSHDVEAVGRGNEEAHLTAFLAVAEELNLLEVAGGKGNVLDVGQTGEMQVVRGIELSIDKSSIADPVVTEGNKDIIGVDIDVVDGVELRGSKGLAVPLCN